jgi:hypothetical protein
MGWLQPAASFLILFPFYPKTKTIPEEVQVHCRLGSLHLPIMLWVKVQGRLTQFPIFPSRQAYKVRPKG